MFLYKKIIRAELNAENRRSLGAVQNHPRLATQAVVLVFHELPAETVKAANI